MVSDAIQLLLTTLLQAQYFEEAATAALRPMLQMAGEALGASRFAGRGSLLRGMVHLRPEDSNLRLAVLDAQTGQAEARAEGEELGLPLLASATAWKAVQAHRCPLSIDVISGVVQPHAPGVSLELFRHSGAGGSEGPSAESRQRFLGRQATHVYVVPLRMPGGLIEGMISLEADCRAAMGQEFIWRGLDGQFQVLADVAGPYLARLRARPVGAPQPDEFLPVVGEAMTQLMPVMRVFAALDETLLISGPTGAGKSRLARWCHAQSERRARPFEVVDLNTVPEDLQMAELFGWKKGAFTGAMRDTQGAVTRAEGGTLFIDEIDKLSLRMQAGLLHVLEERTYRSLGEDAKEKRADVRFMVGTNADLKAAVREGRFREDLYYRLNVLPLRLPPLSERKDEIPGWARHMAQRRHRQRVANGEARLTAAAEQRLVAGEWPGNLRELDNVVRRAYALAMVGAEGALADVVIDEGHVGRALGYDAAPEAQPVTDLLRSAAKALVQEARRRTGPPLDLDITDAFRGIVLGTAVAEVGLAEAFKLFNRERLVTARNHSRRLRLELEKVEALYAALGQGKSPFADVMKDEPSKDDPPEE